MKKKIITITQSNYNKLRKHLLRGIHADEEAAVLLAGTSETTEKIELLVRDVHEVPDSYLLTKGKAGLIINPDFLSIHIKKCRHKNLSFILAHSHPFNSNFVHFSSIDDYGEMQLFPKIKKRAPNGNHAALVLGQNCINARVWLKDENHSIKIDEFKLVSDRIEKIKIDSNDSTYEGNNIDDVYSRQVLAFTEKGQKKLEAVNVGVVGMGGIGSQVFQQLVHIGVKKFILIDYDIIEKSNLARVVGSTFEDVKKGLLKVDIMERLGKFINNNISVICVAGDVNHKSVAKRLRDVDVIFCCTDNMSSRMVINRMAHQYLIPVLDIGVDIQPTEDGKIRKIGGHIVLISPDDYCLDCLGFIDHTLLSYELANKEKRISNPYIQGSKNEYAPSVISLNGALASMAVTEFIHFTTGCMDRKSEKRYQVYDGINGLFRLIQRKRINGCTVCKEVLALGDLIELPCQLDK